MKRHMDHAENTQNTHDHDALPAAEATHAERVVITQNQARIIIFLLLVAVTLLALPSQRKDTSDTAAVDDTRAQAVAAAIDRSVFPEGGISSDATWGNVLPELVARGVIDEEKFAGVFERSGTPLSEEELNLLAADSSGTPITFTAENARFTVNALWALGLAQESDVLTEGPMRTGQTETARFASTGGWTLGEAGAMEYYAKWNLLGLSADDQKRVTRIAETVYRPCCGNSTAFPDCNHGMAMLGLIELMVSQGATDAQIYEAARAANTYWFPQVTAELAMYFQEMENTPWAEVDAARAVSRDFASGAGARKVTQALREGGLVPEAPSGGGSCGA